MSRRSIDRNEDFLFQALDSIVKTLDVMRAEQAAYLHRFKQYDARFENHERKISIIGTTKALRRPRLQGMHRSSESQILVGQCGLPFIDFALAIRMFLQFATLKYQNTIKPNIRRFFVRNENENSIFIQPGNQIL